MFGPLQLFMLLGAAGYSIHDSAKNKAKITSLDNRARALQNGNDPERDRIQMELINKYYSHDEHGNLYALQSRELKHNMGYFRAQCVRRLMKEKGLPVNELLIEWYCKY